MKQKFLRTHRSIFALALIACVTLTAALGAGTLPDRRSVFDADAPYRRLIWVTRWDFSSPRDIERIFENIAAARFTDIFFQVRGEGTLFCKSSYEPWAWELSGRGVAGVGVDPGWDPLAVAVREAHKRGIRIHAWVNTMPGWGQKDAPPKSSGQHAARHPEWFMVDPTGYRMKATGFYACLDPGIPAVRSHLSLLMADIVRRYEVDGVHLDYIRYPLKDEVKRDYSYNPEPLAAFKKQTGKTPAQAPEQWAEFRKKQITETVRMIREATRAVNPKVELSAAVLADNTARASAAQEPEVWLNMGIVDAVSPMAYVRNDTQAFLRHMDTFTRQMNPKTTWVGIWPRTLNGGWLDQVRMAVGQGAGGVAIFSYEELYPKHQPSQRVAELLRVFPAPGGRKPAPAPEIRQKKPNSNKVTRER